MLHKGVGVIVGEVVRAAARGTRPARVELLHFARGDGHAEGSAIVEMESHSSDLQLDGGEFRPRDNARAVIEALPFGPPFGRILRVARLANGSAARPVGCVL